ncbi:MAG: LamG domain-containing protein [Verrucomicrobiaceae bacterium]|nr:LamG domain-containing protein [Verrucomicrobiaceae bacterium]
MKCFYVAISVIFLFLCGCSHINCNVFETKNLVAYWDFDGDTPFTSKGGIQQHTLSPVGNISLRDDGIVSGKSLYLDGKSYLFIPYKKTGTLNVKTNQVTVLAWVKKDNNSKIGFVAGMWNEYQDGGKRQYGLFVSLPYYNGADQVCGHISKLGGPTPPFPYSIDYSASAQKVPFEEWALVGFTYDGTYIRSYMNGDFKARESELISHTKGFKGYPNGLVQSKNPYYYPDGIGDNGSDFTVGAVQLKKGMGNFFKGYINSIAVFDRALSDVEMKQIYMRSLKK